MKPLRHNTDMTSTSSPIEFVWIVWSTDDSTVVAVRRTHQQAMKAAAEHCGCEDIGWTEKDDGWTYLNNMWGYLIRRCLVKVEPPSRARRKPDRRRPKPAAV